ncbi:MAG TPA: hypothetical protein PL143_13190 [Rhodocyclaceae bacterium]|nr:hypothetical protein [Rhodocyclaceae bacterium]
MMTTQTTRRALRVEQRRDTGASGGGQPTGTAAQHGEAHGPDALEDYAGGYIQARHGRVNAWLVVVIVVLIVWAIYYGFTYWGGLGEGLDY